MEQEVLDQVAAGMDDFYQFIASSIGYMKKPRDYGTGEKVNMVEVHTLLMIADHPGICITEVSKMWGHTIAAASRNADRLCKKGYIQKGKLPGNDKNVHLFATEKGKAFAELHKQYDKKEVRADAEHVLRTHTPEEFVAFLSVLGTVREIIEQKNAREHI